MASVLIDTGPIVAMLDRRDAHHHWAVHQIQQMNRVMLTCEAVLAEAAYLVERTGVDPGRVLELLDVDVLTIAFDLKAEAKAVRALMAKYRDVPMDLADACLVRMSEVYPEHRLFTIDSDFHIYRRHRTQPLPLLAPNLQ